MNTDMEFPVVHVPAIPVDGSDARLYVASLTLRAYYEARPKAECLAYHVVLQALDRAYRGGLS